MIIYDPILTGSLNVNGTPLTSIESIDSVSGSVVDLTAASASFSTRVSNAEGSVSSLNAATSSYALEANISGAFTAVSGGLAGRVSPLETSVSALNSATSSYLLNTTDTITGDLTVTGTITAQEFHTEFVSASIIYQSGSTKFGDSADDTHEFTGSINLSGSIKYGGTGLTVTGTSTDGADNQTFFIGAGGAGSDTRGAYIWGRGNEATNGGKIQINAGNVSTGNIELYTGGNVRMFVSSSGTIGFGTSNPLTNLLSIRGYGAVDSNANQGILISSNHYYISGDKYIGNGYASIISQDTGGTYAGFIRFQQAGLNSSGAGAAMTLTNSMVIDSSGNVGIGTTSPSQKLDVNGAIITTDYRSSGTFYLTSGNDWRFRGTGGTEFARLNGSGLGIGTTSPIGKVNIRQSTLDLPSLYLSRYNADDNPLLQIGESDFFGVNGSYGEALIHSFNRDIVFSTSATSSSLADIDTAAMIIEKGEGNVGIGTTSPAYNLDVSGSARVGNYLTFATGPSIPSAAISYHTNGYLYIKGGGSGAAIGDDAFATSMYCIDNGNIEFNTAGTGTKMVITGAGNVGIGTSSPSSRGLQINKASADSGLVITRTGTGAAQFQQFIDGDGNIRFNNVSSTNSIFYTADTERMRIDSSGRVGIGVSDLASTTPLTVGDGTNPRIEFTPVTGAMAVEVLNDGRSLSQPLKIYASETIFHSRNAPSAYAEALRINTVGNVGVGTTSPDSKLHVIHSSTSPGLIVQADAGNEQIVIKRYSNANEQLIFGFHSSDYARIQAVEQGVSYRPLALNQDGGNVGIGTTSPAEKLEVNGNVKVGNIKIQNVNGGRIGFNRNTADGTIYDSNYAAFQINGAYSGADYMEIQNYNSSGTFLGSVALGNGNVGIGYTAPNAKLQVSGYAPTYTDSSTVFWGSTSNNAGHNGISLTSAGNALTGFVGSNLYWNNSSSPSQTNTARSSGYIQFVNTTVAGKRSTIHLGGSVVGSNSISPTMTLNEDSNVGIGTTSPTTKLDVRGVIQGASHLFPDTSGTAQWAKIGTFTAGQGGVTLRFQGYIHSGYNASNAQDIFIEIFFKTSNGSSVDANGFAGNSWYSVKGNNGQNLSPKWVANAAGGSATSYDLYMFLPNYSLSSHYEVTYSNSSIGTTWTNVGSLGQSDPGAGSSTVLLPSTSNNVLAGAVGIGVTTPSNTLHVNSGTTNVVAQFQSTDDTGGIMLKDSSGNVELTTSGTNGFNIQPGGGSTVFRVDGDGKVGIGYTSPSAKLSVNGTIIAGGVVQYTKAYASVDTTGYDIAGLLTSSNGTSAMFIFEGHGQNNDFHIIYHLHNASGNWYWNKREVYRNGILDVVATASGSSTITFTFKATSGGASYTPRVIVRATGTGINGNYYN